MFLEDVIPYCIDKLESCATDESENKLSQQVINQQVQKRYHVEMVLLPGGLGVTGCEMIWKSDSERIKKENLKIRFQSTIYKNDAMQIRTYCGC